jgi:hypothetical protein
MVRMRKFPLDQSPHLDITAGQPPMEIPTLQKVQAKTIPAVEEIPVEKKKDDLQLSWINMQATVNDSLKRDLEVLSEKYEKLAQKEEKRKREKKVRNPPPIPPSPIGSANLPPSMTPPAPVQQTPVQRVLKTGQYQRSRPISLNQF